MQEQRISFETAKLAKEKGFILNYPTACYTDDGQLWVSENLLSERITGKPKPLLIFNAPTQSLLQKWLREKHNIHIEIDLDTDDRFYILKPYKYVVDIYQDVDHKFIKELIDSYEEALEIGLQEAFKLI